MPENEIKLRVNRTTRLIACLSYVLIFVFLFWDVKKTLLICFYWLYRLQLPATK